MPASPKIGEPPNAFRTWLLLTAPVVPNIQRLLDRHGNALGIAKTTSFEAYETSITLPHRNGLVRFQLHDGPLSERVAGIRDLPDHSTNLETLSDWRNAKPQAAVARHGMIVAELIEQASEQAEHPRDGAFDEIVAVVWGGAVLTAAQFLEAVESGRLSRPEPSGRASGQVDRDAERSSAWWRRLIGR